MKKIIAICIMALFLLNITNISQSETNIFKSDVKINFIDSGMQVDGNTDSQFYGFIIPVDSTQSFDKQTKIIRLVNEILNNGLNMYWISKDQIKSNSDGNIVLGKGGYIIPFTGNPSGDSIICAIVNNYKDGFEIQKINNKIYDVNVYKLVEPKIALFSYRYQYSGESYLLESLGFKNYEHLSWEDVNPKLNNNDFNAFIWPGGDANIEGLIEDQFHTEEFNTIRNFVGNGGGYIGFCYGGYEASKSYVLPTSWLKPYLSENPILPPFLSILDSNTFRALPGIGGVTIKIVNSNNPISFGLGELFPSFSAAGPIFLNCKGDTEIVGVIDSIDENFLYGEEMPINWFLEDYYDTELPEEIIDLWANFSIGKPSWVTSKFGSGKIAVFGDHPESSPRVFANSLFYTTSKGPFEVDITIGNCSNLPPVAYDDYYMTSHDTVLNIEAPGILENDADPEQEPLIAKKISNPQYGDIASFNSDGSVIYIPRVGYRGKDSFNYEIEDIDGNTDMATVYITVVPIANDDYYTVTQYDPYYYNCLNNDEYFYDETLTAKKISNPQHGEIIDFETHGSFGYKTIDNYTGLDSFTYEIEDSRGNKDTATIYMTIEPATHPMAYDDRYFVEKNKNLVVTAPGVLENDIDIIGNGLIARKISDPRHGQIILFGINGGFIYKPEEDFTGWDSFSYEIIDRKGGTDQARIDIYIKDEAPVAIDDYYTISKNNGLSIKAPGLLENDISNNEEDYEFYSYKLSDPVHGTLTYLKEDGSFSYLPDKDYTGSDNFTYRSCNGVLFSEPATVHIKIASTNTWYVDDDAQDGGDGSEEHPFKTITVALNKAETYLKDIRDTIFVNPGTYYENLEIEKSINLIGIKNRGYPTIKITESNKHAISVLTSNVKIENLVVEDVAGSSSYAIKVGKNGILPIKRVDINNCRLFYCSNGILFDNVKYGSVGECYIFAKDTGNYINGILITDGSKKIDIFDCEIIFFDYGINVISSSDIKIKNNDIVYCECGISNNESPFNEIKKNYINYNELGISIKYCIFPYDKNELINENNLFGNNNDIIIEQICGNLTADAGGPYSASTSVAIGSASSSGSTGTGGSQDASGQQGQVDSINGGTVTATDSDASPIFLIIKNSPIKTKFVLIFYKLLNLLNRIRSRFTNKVIGQTSTSTDNILSMLQTDQMETSRIGSQRSIDTDGDRAASSDAGSNLSPEGTQQTETGSSSSQSSVTRTPSISTPSSTRTPVITAPSTTTTPIETIPSSTTNPVTTSPSTTSPSTTAPTTTTTGATTPSITTPGTTTPTTTTPIDPGGVDSAPSKTINPTNPATTTTPTGGGSETVYVTINFDGSNSQPRDQIKKYHWDFGDGNSKTSILARCIHTYTITVSSGGDGGGNEGTNTPDNYENFVANSEDVQSATSGSIMNALGTNTDVSTKPLTTPSSGSTGSSSTQDVVRTFTVTLTIEDENGNTATDTTTVIITIHVTTNTPGTPSTPSINPAINNDSSLNLN